MKSPASTSIILLNKTTHRAETSKLLKMSSVLSLKNQTSIRDWSIKFSSLKKGLVDNVTSIPRRHISLIEKGFQQAGRNRWVFADFIRIFRNQQDYTNSSNLSRNWWKHDPSCHISIVFFISNLACSAAALGQARMPSNLDVLGIFCCIQSTHIVTIAQSRTWIREEGVDLRNAIYAIAAAFSYRFLQMAVNTHSHPVFLWWQQKPPSAILCSWHVEGISIFFRINQKNSSGLRNRKPWLYTDTNDSS